MHHFLERNFLIPLLGNAWFLYIVLELNQANADRRCEMTALTAFKAQRYFHAMALISREVGMKKPNMLGNLLISTTASMAAQVVQKAWNAFTNVWSPSKRRAVIQTYLGLEPAGSSFQVSSQHSDGFVLLKQQQPLSDAGPSLYGPIDVDAGARSRSQEGDERIRSLFFSMFSLLSKSITKALNIFRPRTPQLKIAEFDENR